MTTITINERTQAGKTLFELAQKLAVKNKSITIKKAQKTATSKEVVFLEELKRSAQHAQEIAKGTRKGNSIKALMDEL